MGKSSSAKKVARAARAGGTTSSSDKREVGFPLVIAGVFLVGTAGIFAAKSSQTAQAEGIALGQHWHAAYEIVACGETLPGQLDNDPNEIHHIHAHLNGEGTDADGLMHVHPQSSQFTRDGGTVGAFLQTVGADLDDDRLELADGTVFDEEEGCDGEDAVLRIAKWDNALATSGEASEISDRRLSRTRFQADGEAYTIFFGPSDADIPPPSNAANVSNASDIQAPTVLSPEVFAEDGVLAEDIDIETSDGGETPDETETSDDGETSDDDGAGDDDTPVDGADEAESGDDAADTSDEG